MARLKKLETRQWNVAPVAMVDTAMICRAVANDFKTRGISHMEAATKLGVAPRSVSNQISGRRPFGKKSAKLYAKVFGYDEEFLLYGTGSLKNGMNAPTIFPSVRGDKVTIPREQWDSLLRHMEKLKQRQQRLGSRGLRRTRIRVSGTVLKDV